MNYACGSLSRDHPENHRKNRADETGGELPQDDSAFKNKDLEVGEVNSSERRTGFGGRNSGGTRDNFPFRLYRKLLDHGSGVSIRLAPTVMRTRK